RSYGDLIVIDAGELVVMVAGAEPAVRTGESVTRGDPIATMRQTGAEPPALYLEVRRNGRPVDVNRLLGGGGRGGSVRAARGTIEKRREPGGPLLRAKACKRGLEAIANQNFQKSRRRKPRAGSRNYFESPSDQTVNEPPRAV